MKNEDVVKVYDQVAEEYSKRYDHLESEDDLVFLNTFIAHLKPEYRIADIGCGTGYSAGYFAKHGMKPEGVDLSSGMIQVARRNYPDLTFKEEDLRTYQPEQLVDAVWAGYCLFHLEQQDFEKTLKHIRSYLKPGGVFGLVMQEGEGDPVDLDEPLLPGEKIYVHPYTEEELERLLEKHGFKIFDRKRKPPMYEMEFPYNKLLLIAK